MERKEIMALVIAVLGVILLIGIIRTVTGKDRDDDADSRVLTTPATIGTFATTTTDYWDYLHQQQSMQASETTTTEVTVTEAVTSLLPDAAETTLPEPVETADETAPYIAGTEGVVATDAVPAATQTTTATEQPAQTGYAIQIN